MGEDVVDLLRQLVSIDSVNAHISGVTNPEARVHEFIEKWAQNMGFTTQRLHVGSQEVGPNYNLLISYSVSEKAPWLLFESHSDTVGVEGMTIEPFNPFLEAGRLFGRGACDTKGSGAAMLCALREYAESSDKKQNIAILFVTEEEITKKGVNTFVSKQLASLPWVPSGVIVGEPTNCRLVVAHNGVMRWKVAVRGVAAHSSNPSLGLSAISKMAKLLLVFEKQYCQKLDMAHPLTGKAACSVNIISGGRSVNIIPAYCEVEIDRRVLPGENVLRIVEEYSQVITDISERDGAMDVAIFPPFIDRALDPSTNRSLAERVSRVLERLDLDPSEYGVGYGTDASTYSQADIPAIVLGPGSIDQAHTEDEWIEISELFKAQRIYLKLMMST